MQRPVPMPHVRRLAALAVVLTAVAVGPAPASTGTRVGDDPPFDWGANWGPGLTKVGETLGEDLVGARAGADPDTVTFVFELLVLPSTYAGLGGWPNVPRYMWEMGVDGRLHVLDGLFRLEDPSCLPSRCTTSRFTLKSDCTSDAAGVITCAKRVPLTATFAQGPPGTVTVPVPREALGATGDDVLVTPAKTPFGEYLRGNVIATSLSFSDTLYPADALETRPFRIERTRVVPVAG